MLAAYHYMSMPWKDLALGEYYPGGRRAHVRTRVRGGADEEGTGQGTSPTVAFVSIWVYALAAGFVALGISHGIPAIIHPRYLRVPLQWATIPAVAVLAGLAGGSALTRVYRGSLPSRSDGRTPAHRA
jgi:hypothetical protein